jgi:hypothetical protein
MRIIEAGKLNRLDLFDTAGLHQDCYKNPQRIAEQS